MSSRHSRELPDAALLVVDDKEHNRILISTILRRAGFRNITCVADGESALAAIETGDFDCVLLDVMMPGLSGHEVCRRLREKEAFKALPVLMQTAQMERAGLWAAFEAGATDVIHKPFDPRELIARVKVHASAALMSRHDRASQQEMQLELAEAKAVIETILPQPEELDALRRQGLDLQWFIRPSSALGGDHWSAWPLDGDRIALFFADVSGHGIAAALRAFALHSLLSPSPSFAADPLRMAAHLDSRLLAVGQQGQFRFVAAMYGIFDRAAGRLSYVAGGLRDALLLRADGELRRLSLSGLPFGLIEDCPREIRQVPIGHGDRLVLFSDALIEQFGEEGRPLPETEVVGWLAGRMRAARPKEDLARRIAGDFLAGNPDCSDDLLVVAAAFPGFPSPVPEPP